MRAKRHLGTLALVVSVGAIIGTSGCAQTLPCMIIPAQIELAESKRDQVKESYDRKMEEVNRALNNYEVSQGRLERLVEERDELRSLLGNGGEQ